MKKTFFLLIILFSITLYSQKREFLKGKLLYKNTNVPAANVINNSAQFATITDSNGEFEIPVLDGDEVIFSSVQYKIRTIKVTSEMIRKRRIIVSVNESITELDEVVVTPGNTEKFLDLKEEEFKGFDYSSDKSTKIENKLTDNRVLSNGIDFVNVTRLILKALSNNNKNKSKIKPSEILPYVFDNVFFLQDLNLKQDQVIGFLEYIDKKIPSEELLKQSQKLQLIDFLIKESEKYIKNLSE
ncbi:MAG: hypothetical protein CMC33_03250 [Flavobacteriaceae bacterium]|nr:hypothetical protein [Flavobacteriaceae bacterium]